MKRLVFFLFILSLTNVPIICYSNVISIKADTLRTYKIIEIKKTKKKINSTNKAYIILIQDSISNQVLTLVSLKNDYNSTMKIKKGNHYSLKLIKYFDQDYIINFGIKLSVTIDGVLINIPSTWETPNIYTTPNLKGLYYLYN